MSPISHKRALYSLILLLLVFGAGCSSDSNESESAQSSNPNDFLVNYTAAQQLNTQSINTLYSLTWGENSTARLQDIQLYKIEYSTTTFNQEPITASGLVLLPTNRNQSLGVVSLQHGTLLNDFQAPSTANILNSETAIGAVLAGHGFAVVMPDYLGYQSSNQISHPYEEQSTLAQSTYDMLQASYELFNEIEVQLNNKLFLAGYSEGGYATMALHRKIESEDRWDVTHSYPAAGAYNKTAFSRAVLEQDQELPYMLSYLWVLYTYNTLYPTLNRPWNTIVQDSYAELMEGFNPLQASFDTLAEIPQNPQELFRPEFIQGILSGTDSAFLEVLDQNDNFDWVSEAPITLFHGTADDYVLPLNSQTAYDALSQYNAEVNYIALSQLDHSSAVLPYLQQVLTQLLLELN